MTYATNELGGWDIPAHTEIAPRSEIPRYSTLGDGCKLGNGCAWLGVAVAAWMTLGNVDGSGRQIKCVVGADGSRVVEAGCFRGSPEEFAARATAEGKAVYARVIPAVFAAMCEGER